MTRIFSSARLAVAVFVYALFSFAAAAEQANDGGPSLRKQLDDIISAARYRTPDAVAGFSGWRASKDPGALESLFAEENEFRDILDQLILMADIGDAARDYGLTALGNPDFDENRFRQLIRDALDADASNAGLALETVETVASNWRAADQLIRARDQVLRRFMRESRQGEAGIGTRLAWYLIRVGAADPTTRIDPRSFSFDDDSARIEVVHHGARATIRLDKDDYRKRTRAVVDGYRFRTGWTVLLQKPLSWMAAMSREMRAAGVDPDETEWEILEAPYGLVALADSFGDDGGRAVPRRIFYRGEVRETRELPVREDAPLLIRDFRSAAETLHDGVMRDNRIPKNLRHALNPVLMGAYKEIDKRDYFDNAFCRRLIEADYLETTVNPLPPERAAELAAYRKALAKIEAGYDRFAVDLGNGAVLTAVTRPEIDDPGADGEPADSETGETLPPYEWRLEGGGQTVFHSPLPGRYVYTLSLAEIFDGIRHSRPKGLPAAVEVWHPVLGRVAGWRDGEFVAGDKDNAWLDAVVMDARGRKDPTAGPLGWNFPAHVLIRDEQGDPAAIATPSGVAPGPDFSAFADPDARRAAQDEWLDRIAGVLRTPGELQLIFTHFFRYCSDSPLPEMPNLIGSHYGLSDTHQTIHQSLDRRWAGRLIGDCDDLAEFFQALLARQGRLAHVMQLPSHAAAGFLEREDGDGEWRFVVLQTGPVLQFAAATAGEAIEKAYRSFDKDGGGSNFTAAAAPLLLRFADEETRTPFLLSSRIYWDRDYAEAMIRVQEYWHLHTYSAAVREMEAMIQGDRDVANIKELASLYERTGRYRQAESLRREEYDAAGGDAQARLSALVDLAQLHVQEKDNPRALDTLALVEEELNRLLNSGERDAFDRATTFRAHAALLLARLGEAERGWELMRRDIESAGERGGRCPDYLVRVLSGLYDRMAHRRNVGAPVDAAVFAAVESALEGAFRTGYFQEDDTYNRIMGRYFWLGRYAVAKVGRRAGLEQLLRDGPYPAETQTAGMHTVKTGLSADPEWEWLRINPRLYLSFALEMLDRDDRPELYDPDGARSILEATVRAAERGAASGAESSARDAVVKSRLLLAFLNHDLAAFSEVMTEVRDKNYSSLYDETANAFGGFCGLVPVEEFGPWIEAFHRFFPGRQHYFKAAYRAMDKEHFDHAAMLGRASAGFFPDDAVLVREAEALAATVEHLKSRIEMRSRNEKEWATAEAKPAA